MEQITRFAFIVVLIVCIKTKMMPFLTVGCGVGVVFFSKSFFLLFMVLGFLKLFQGAISM